MAKSSTSFKFGNTAWQARSKAGRNPIFKTPKALEKACYEYFQWVQDNPLISAETVKFQGVGKTMAVPKMRPMTLIGLCNFLDIVLPTWHEYAKRPDFTLLCKKVENAIYQQKLEGAAADMLNANIIARELGLVDKQETSVTGDLTVAGDVLYRRRKKKEKG